MPEQITITAYKLEELEGKAKDRAMESLRDMMNNTFESDSITDLFKEDLREHYGIDTFSNDLEIHWSLASCQGDGVSFTGRLDPDLLLKCEKTKDTIGKIIKKLKRTQHAFSIYINRIDHHYTHIHTVRVSVEIEGNHGHPLTGDETKAQLAAIDKKMDRIRERAEKIAEELQEAIGEYIIVVARELEKMGYEEIEHQSSDEYIQDFAEANDPLFDKNGKRILHPKEKVE